ncbi:MAG: acyl-synthetase, LuxE family protein, partial [Pseudomonas sp.]|nr:acyl-synthetase, LuxE family protein [Pseudomonas sp.]
MLNLDSVERLCTLDQPYQHGSAVDRLFADAMREMTALHVQRTPGYAQWLSSQG